MPSPTTALCVIHPEALPRAEGRDSEAQVGDLLAWVCRGAPSRTWPQRLHALYCASPVDSRVALAIADLLWLRPQLLLPPGLPPAHWAGALDQLGRQHAGGTVVLVASRAAVSAALYALLQRGRAKMERRRDEALCELSLAGRG